MRQKRPGGSLVRAGFPPDSGRWRRGGAEWSLCPPPHVILLLQEDAAMRSILLWVIGVPIPLILLLAFCTHHF